jgi:hypothetical protein
MRAWLDELRLTGELVPTSAFVNVYTNDGTKARLGAAGSARAASGA